MVMRITRLSRTTPSELLNWIQEQLENRGIDAVVYTRYILSLLQDDDDDDDDENGGHLKNNNNWKSNYSCDYHSHTKNRQKDMPKEGIRLSSKWKHKRYAKTAPNVGKSLNVPIARNCFYCWNELGNPINEDRKLLVIECLKSASEQEFGIESFVDELCAKLRNVKMNLSTHEFDNDDHNETAVSKDAASVSPLEQAQQYFAAFPELGCSSTEKALPIETLSMLEVRRNRLENMKDWDGRRIVKQNEQNNNNDKMVDDSSDRQTSTADSIYTHNTNDKLEIHNGNEKIDSIETVSTDTFDRLLTDNLYLINDISFIEEDAEPEQSLVTHVNHGFGNVSKYNRSDDFDTFQKLVDKFNSSIASIWTDTGRDVNAKTDNIWSFDSSVSSEQSSTAASPKVPVDALRDIWKSNDSPDVNLLVSHSAQSQIWEPMKSTILTPNNGIVDDDHHWTHCRIGDENFDIHQTVTLSNHKSDSLFIEFPPRFLSKFKPIPPQVIPKKEVNDKCMENFDSAENLLTSPKTHFQPIKQDSIEEPSDDSAMEADAEVARLTACTVKCPNNVNDEIECLTRPLSTSMEELESFMGPFTDDASIDDLSPLTEESDQTWIRDAENYKDKATNTDDEHEVERAASLLETIYENESEPEYKDLCIMLNKVLREGINEESINESIPIKKDCTLSSLWDCGDEDNDMDSALKEQRLSWNCYFDAFHAENGKSLKEDLSGTLIEFGTGESHHIDDFSLYGNFVKENHKQNDGAFECNGKSGFWFSKETQNDYFSIDDDLINPMNPMESNFANKEPIESLWPLESKADNDESYTFKLEVKSRNSSDANEKLSSKPCTFFMEGNCKRADCRYSHDISNITCKFWNEGFCFKEDSCPFRHGYLAEVQDDDQSFYSNTTYTISSESDFPSLAQFSDDLFESNIYPEPTDANGKIPLVLFLKKKMKKRRDKNLQ